jgi:hypothetical protein
MTIAADLQQRAIEFARSGNFGQEAFELNRELTRVAPANEGAWTRLARCGLESGQLDEATAALDVVLGLNPQNTIARSLQVEVSKRRAGAAAAAAAVAAVKVPKAKAVRAAKPKRDKGVAPVAAFTRQEFQTLGHLEPAPAMDVLGPRIESLLMAVNERSFAEKAVETRHRAGRPGVRLFRRDSFHSGAAGQIFAFQYGGRWEPQIHVAFTAATHPASGGRDSLRAGIGFSLAHDDKDPEGHGRVLAFFAQFQQLVASDWRHFLTEWLSKDNGFVQFGHDQPPQTAVPPADAVDALVSLEDPAAAGWVFCGRWLFADTQQDADTLGDAAHLVKWIEQTFDDLLPLWSSVYRAKN